MTDIRILDRTIGPGHPTYLIAELSGNHNGDIGRALATIDAIADTGADAIKLQTYTPDTITLKSKKPDFVVQGGPWAGRTLWDLYDEAHTPWDWHEKLFERARKHGLHIFSTPFDDTAVDFLERLGVPVYKVASFELTDDGLLRKVARTGKPVIASTGMATLAEVSHAVEVLRSEGAREIVLLRCTSAYPAPDEAMNLAGIPLLAAATGCLTGLSDHSLGVTAPVVAVTLGARVIEKHVTLDRAAGGVDSHFSLEPAEFADMVKQVRRAERMVGTPRFGSGVAEEGNVVFRRSLYVTRDIVAGERLSADNVRSVRPGHGLSPRFLDMVLGKRVRHRLEANTPLRWDAVMEE